MNMNVTRNKKAYFNYTIIEEYDCGIILEGAEVKSIRQGNVMLTDSYAYINKNEVWVRNFKVSRYKQMYKDDPFDTNREKKLLLTKSQIRKIARYLEDKGITCIPLLVFAKNNKIKVKIGIAKGKKLWDKSQSIKEKDVQRELKREMNIKI